LVFYLTNEDKRKLKELNHVNFKQWKTKYIGESKF
jgi:hypothetical protein